MNALYNYTGAMHLSWCNVKAGKSLKIQTLDLPAFTQVIGPITLGFSAKTFCRLQKRSHTC
jgi:hypothetical protein